MPLKRRVARRRDLVLVWDMRLQSASWHMGALSASWHMGAGASPRDDGDGKPLNVEFDCVDSSAAARRRHAGQPKSARAQQRSEARRALQIKLGRASTACRGGTGAADKKAHQPKAPQRPPARQAARVNAGGKQGAALRVWFGSAIGADLLLRHCETAKLPIIDRFGLRTTKSSRIAGSLRDRVEIIASGMRAGSQETGVISVTKIFLFYYAKILHSNQSYPLDEGRRQRTT